MSQDDQKQESQNMVDTDNSTVDTQTADASPAKKISIIDDSTSSVPKDSSETAQNLPQENPNQSLDASVSESVQSEEQVQPGEPISGVAQEDDTNVPNPDAEQSSQTFANPDEATFDSEKEESSGEIKDNPMAITPKTKNKSTTPKGAIIVAAVIGLILITVSIFAYIKMQDEVKTESANGEQNSQVSDDQPVVSEGDLDNTVKELEAEINKTNDAEDIPTEDSVSDAALGL